VLKNETQRRVKENEIFQVLESYNLNDDSTKKFVDLMLRKVRSAANSHGMTYQLTLLKDVKADSKAHC